MKSINPIKINITGTDDTPSVNFDLDNNYFEISGRSMPENAIEFYQPIMNWLNNFNATSNTPANFVFKLDYLNTSSSKSILALMYKLEEIREQKGVNLMIHWYYDELDEDMQEAGEDYASSVRVPFKNYVLEAAA